MTFSSSKKETIKLGGLLFSSAIVGKLVSVPAGIIIARILGPEQFGGLAIIYLIIKYFSYHHLGLLAGLSRNVPIAYGRGDLHEVKTIVNTVFTSYFFSAALGLSVLWVLFFSGVTLSGTLDLKMTILLTLIIIVERTNSFFHTYTKAEGKFILYGKKDFLTSLVNPILNVAGVFFFHLFGILISLFFIDLVSLTYNYLALKRPRFSIRVDFRKTMDLLRTGFIIFINNISEGLVVSLNTLLLTLFMGKVEVGLFAMAMAIATTSKVPFSEAMAITVGRKMLLDGGKHGTENLDFVKKYTESVLALYLLLNAFILGLMVIFYFFTVNVFLPDFKPSLPLMIVIYFGYLIYTARHFLSNYFMLTNQLHKRLVMVVVGLAINTLMSYCFIRWGWASFSVACACSFTFVFISGNVIVLSFAQIYGRISAGIVFFARLCSAAGILTLILTLLYRWKIFELGTHTDKFILIVRGGGDMIIKAALFTALCLGVFLMLFRKFGLFDEIKRIADYMISSVRRVAGSFLKRPTLRTVE